MSIRIGLLIGSWTMMIALAGAPAPAAEPAGGATAIDVSHHSGEVDWQEVAEQRVGLVYLKATEGVDDADPMFEEHWRALGELGIARGAYHFFVTEDDPEEQARFFLSRLELAAGDLPPVVDIELIGHGTTGDVKTALRRFLEIVETELGVTPVIYTSPNFWNAHFDASFGRYPLWIAEYGVDQPTLPAGWSSWLMWQYEENAAVPGIENGADRSRLHPEANIAVLTLPTTSAP